MGSEAVVHCVELRPLQFDDASAGRTLLSRGQTSRELDEVDARLVELLLADPDATNRSLADATSVGEVTVGARLRRLVEDRVLVFSAVLDWHAAGFDWFVIGKFGVDGRSPSDVARDLAALDSCDAVAVVFGDADVLAYFLVADRVGLNDLVEVQLAGLSGITSLRIDLATRSGVTEVGASFYFSRRPPPVRLPNPVIEVDEVDAAILQALVDDSRQSSRNIARATGVSEGTIRARVARMADAGLMRRVAMVEPLALGLAGLVAEVGLRVDRASLTSVVDRVRSLPEVLFWAVTVGSVDISLGVATADQSHLMELVINRLRSIPGVRETETLVMVDVVRFSPHMRRIARPA